MTSEKLQVMRKTWAEYANHKLVEPQNIRPHVANSWQRCRKLNVDPYCDQKLIISPKDLKQRMAQFKDLITVALPTMKNIYNFVRESGFKVVLADEDGYVLSIMGGPENSANADDEQMCAGANWSELYKGTNAIGTCLVERQPLLIHAVEHFCETNHLMTCSAAPIHDPNGKLIGVLNLTGEYHHANDHTLGMVVAGANAIENQFRLHRTNHKLFSAYKYSETIINTMSEGLMTVDTKGIVTQLNEAAAHMVETTASEAISIHTLGPRRDKPFVAINCSATPETLIESELFGYVDGAFTGASKGGKAGKFEMADGGTLFLDEIGDMPMYTQVKLLRVIQERRVSRVGSSTEIPVNIRIIAATRWKFP